MLLRIDLAIVGKPCRANIYRPVAIYGVWLSVGLVCPAQFDFRALDRLCLCLSIVVRFVRLPFTALVQPVSTVYPCNAHQPYPTPF